MDRQPGNEEIQGTRKKSAQGKNDLALAASASPLLTLDREE
jgi:hypothetical protein